MTDQTRDIVERLRKLLPVSWDNECDGHGEPTHAVLTFGEHQTQAMTLCPDDWMTLNDLPDHIEALTKRVAELEGALELIADRAAKLRTGTDDWFELVEFESCARAALSNAARGEEG